VVDPRSLEAIAARGWAAAESAAMGGWSLYAASGKSGRINTCWTHGPPDREVEAAIDAAEAWYLARGIRPRFKLAPAIVSPGDLAERLTRRGYSANTPTLTMVGRLAGAPEPEAAVHPAPIPEYQRLFADPSFGEAVDARERLDALARIPAPRGFALITLDGEPAAIGACAVEGDWAGFMGMRTAPAFRRRGLARRAFRALADFGLGAGASQGYLQVEAGNASAIALYASEGFETAYRYEYWAKS
jgi:ribosomal protein S18 acetylase RimI-like enzyme